MPWWTLGIVVRGEFGEQVSKVAFTEGHEAVEALGPNGLHESLRVWIAIRAARGDRATLDAIGFKEVSPRVGEERIAIVDQMRRPAHPVAGEKVLPGSLSSSASFH
jgi:hypothetical protein